MAKPPESPKEVQDAAKIDGVDLVTHGLSHGGDKD
jgi:hypothetical protein